MNFNFIVGPKFGFENFYELVRKGIDEQAVVVKLSEVILYLFRAVALFSMFDFSNPLILLFTPEFSSALGGCSAVHLFDLHLFLADHLTLVAPLLLEPFLPVGAYTITWCPPNSSILQGYDKAYKLQPHELTHAYITPTEDLNTFIKSQCKVVTYKARGRLKILRVIRIVLRYARTQKLQMISSYVGTSQNGSGTIFRTDGDLKTALKVNYFHAMDVSAIVQNQSTDFSICTMPTCKKH